MRHLSLFTGSGIGDLAAKNAGIETIAQCENDPVCQYALRKLWPECHLFGDVRDVSVESLRRLGLLPIDILSGGFPCQDLSTAGRGKGIEGSRSGLWREMFRVIRQVRPAWCLIENVPVLRVRGADRVIAPMERIGYTVWPLVVGAWNAGAPHERARVWIVARHKVVSCSVGTSEVAEETSGMAGGMYRPQQLADAISPAIREAPPSRPGGADGVAAAGAGEAVGYTLHDGLRVGGRLATEGPLQRRDGPVQWPSRPGQPQLDWEEPRVIERSLGGEFDGFPKKVQRRANKALLRILGNAWLEPLVEIIFQWIKTMDQSG